MKYKGYHIRVYWKHEEKGYTYSIYKADGCLLTECEGVFFHIENAKSEAKKLIDTL